MKSTLCSLHCIARLSLHILLYFVTYPCSILPYANIVLFALIICVVVELPNHFAMHPRFSLCSSLLIAGATLSVYPSVCLSHDSWYWDDRTSFSG